MLSLVAAVVLQIITKPLKCWNFPSLFNEDQGESYVTACRIISSVSLLYLYSLWKSGVIFVFLEETCEPILSGEEHLSGWCCLREWLSRVRSFCFGLRQKMSHFVSPRLFTRQSLPFVFPKFSFPFSQFEIFFNLGEEENSYKFPYCLVSKSKASFLV